MATRDSSFFPTFSQFIDSIASARHEDYAKMPAVKVTKDQQFEAMRQHIIDLHEGVVGLPWTHLQIRRTFRIFSKGPRGEMPDAKGNVGFQTQEIALPQVGNVHESGYLRSH